MKKLPKYQQISLELEKIFLSPQPSTQKKLPSDNQLMKQFGVSRSTIRHALQLLVNKGIITRRRGSGTYPNFPQSRIILKSHSVYLPIFSTVTYPLPSPPHGFYADLLSQLLQIATRYFIHLLPITCSLEKVSFSPELDNFCFQHGPCIILGDFYLPHYLPFFPKLPLILIDAPPPSDYSLPITVISPPHEEAGYLATCYLLERGHRKIAFLGVPHPNYQLRLSGYIRALSHHGIAFNPQLCFMSENVAHRLLLDHQLDIDAWCCASDWLATRLIPVCERAQLPVPEKISIISIDGTSLVYHTKPTLTCVLVNRSEIVEQVLATVHRYLEGSLSCSPIETILTSLSIVSGQTVLPKT